MAHVTNNSENDEWYTPPELVEYVRQVLGGVIELDPASSHAAQQVVKAQRYFTKEDDALGKPWDASTVFLNPPYSRKLLPAFVAKLLTEQERWGFKAVVLVNNATETKAAQRLLNAATCVQFLDGRVKFLAPDLQKRKTPLQGQMLLGFGIWFADSGWGAIAGLGGTPVSRSILTEGAKEKLAYLDLVECGTRVEAQEPRMWLTND